MVAAFEILVNIMAVANVIRTGKIQAGGTSPAGAMQGMQTMEASLKELLKAAEITAEADGNLVEE